MSQATLERAPINGVDVPTLFATIDAVAGQPELAKFQFRATNEWQAGTHSKTSIKSFYGAGGDHDHLREFVLDADHHPVLVGEGNGPAPIEFILAGLVSCLTAGVGNIASARGVKLTSVKSSVVGEMDLRGILGISDQVRNGFQKISVDFEIEGDAQQDVLLKIADQSKARSAVYDILTNQVPVEITVNGV